MTAISPEAEAQDDDTPLNPDDFVIVPKSALLQLFGRFGLPPWPDGKGGWLGGDVDCALLAKDISDSVDTLCKPLTWPARRPVESAWGLIANAYGGNWDRATDDWRKAAESWRDEFWQGPSRSGSVGVVRPMGEPDDG